MNFSLKQLTLITIFIFYPLTSYSMNNSEMCGECSKTKLSYLGKAIAITAGVGAFIWFMKKSDHYIPNGTKAWVGSTLPIPLAGTLYFLTQAASNVIHKQPFKTPCAKCTWTPADQLTRGVSIISSYSLATLGVSLFNNDLLRYLSIMGSTFAGFTITPWALEKIGCKADTIK